MRLLILLLLAITLSAQTVEIYIMPLKGGGSRENPRRPKYAEQAISYGSTRFGEEGETLTAMLALADSHAIIQADADVIRIDPANLDNTLSGGAVTTITNFLEARNIPANWITTSNTSRQVLRVTLGVFLFTQRYAKLAGKQKIFLAGVDLTKVLSSFPANVRTNLIQAADDLGLDRSTVNNTWTIRQLLRHFGQQWVTIPINLNVVTI